MEHHGIKGRIQVSESVAQDLISKNRGHWLIPREDKIQAKGKGELQTYWVHIEGKSTIRGTSHGGMSVGQSSVSGGDDVRSNDTNSIEISRNNKVENADVSDQHLKSALEQHHDGQDYFQWREKLKTQFSIKE